MLGDVGHMTGGGEGGGNSGGGGGATDVIPRSGGDGFVGVRRWGKDSWGVETLSAASKGLSQGRTITLSNLTSGVFTYIQAQLICRTDFAFTMEVICLKSSEEVVK